MSWNKNLHFSRLASEAWEKQDVDFWPIDSAKLINRNSDQKKKSFLFIGSKSRKIFIAQLSNVKLNSGCLYGIIYAYMNESAHLEPSCHPPQHP